MKHLVPQPARDLSGPPIKVDRKLPPHELNARRNRKRNITHLPAISSLPSVGELLSIEPGQKAKPSNHNHVGDSINDHIYNPATNPINDSKA